MTAFKTEIELGARGTGFSAEEIAEQEAVVKARYARLQEAIEHDKPRADGNINPVAPMMREHLQAAETRLACMHLHNRLRALETAPRRLYSEDLMTGTPR